MPTDIWKIPYDGNGVVRGSYYLRHKDTVTDTVGVVPFVGGRSAEPVTGRTLVALVAAIGIDLDLEPADDEARAAMGVSSKPAPVASAAKPETVEPAAEPDPRFVPDTEPAPSGEGFDEGAKKPSKHHKR